VTGKREEGRAYRLEGEVYVTESHRAEIIDCATSPLPRVYAITDVGLSGLSHAEQVKLIAAGGASLIQLREKSASPLEFYEASLLAVANARELGVKLIINDRVDIAMAVKADGVHLGQDDLPPDRARMLLGDSCLIGYSTHSFEQAIAADTMPIDYIAFGPIFETATKQNPDPVVGLNALRLLTQRVAKPVVAIGGINRSNIRSVIEAGAMSAAIIADLLKAEDISEQFRLLNALASARD